MLPCKLAIIECWKMLVVACMGNAKVYVLCRLPDCIGSIATVLCAVSYDMTDMEV